MFKKILSKAVFVSFLLSAIVSPVAVLAQTADTTPPVITLIGQATAKVVIGQKYLDRGAIAWDSVDGNLTNKIVMVNPVSTSTLGTYLITYNVSDAAGNAAAQVTRTVNVIATSTPAATSTPIPVPANQRVILQGYVSSLTSSSSLVLLTKRYGSQNITATTTIIIKRGKLANFSDIAVGFKLFVIGKLDTATNSVTAEFINITGKKSHQDNGWRAWPEKNLGKQDLKTKNNHD